MTWFRRRPDPDRELDEEIQFHLRQEAQLRRDRGEPDAAAAENARREFGNVLLIKETTRDMWRSPLLDDVVLDLRYGVRALRRAPAVAVTAIVSLALGIGASTAIFTVVNAVLLKPLPYPAAHTLVAIAQDHPTFGLEPATLPDFQDWRAQTSTLWRMGGAWTAAFNLTGVDEPERLSGAMVAGDLFGTLQVVPAAGGMFGDHPNQQSDVVILSHSLWSRRFGAARDVVGRRVELNGRPHTVIGVMPYGFSWPPGTDVWMPLVPEAGMNRGYHMLQVVGRMLTGESVATVQADLGAIAAASAAAYPEFNKDRGVRVSSLLQSTVGSATRSLWILSGAALCLLLIACANVASLLASRAVSRRLELALRSALGASRHRLLRQLLTESLLLSLLAGAAGLALAATAIDPLLALTALPRAAEVSLDLRVFAMTVAASVATAFLIGVLSAWSASRADLREVQNNRGSTRTGWLRPSLLVLEVAAALVLLAGSALLIRSFHRLNQVDTGFDTDRLLTMRFVLPRVSHPPDRVVQLYRDMIERVDALPGVTGAAVVSAFPFSGTTANVVFAIPSQPSPSPGTAPASNFAAATPGYFLTMGMELIAGRDFAATDDAGKPFVAIVNQSMARRFFPGADPIGQTVRILGPRPRTIIGVVSDVRQRALDQGPEPEIYVPHAQSPFGGMFLVVRSAVARPERLIASARAAIRELDGNMPIAEVRTADEILGGTLSARRFSMLLLSIFGGAALLLAVVGIYGVLSFAVAQRTAEIGIRLALGAARRHVMALMLWHGLWPVIAGLAAGLALTLAATRVLHGALFEIHPRDPFTLTAVMLLLLATAIAAAYLPARRASRIDPHTALQ